MYIVMFLTIKLKKKIKYETNLILILNCIILSFHIFYFNNCIFSIRLISGIVILHDNCTLKKYLFLKVYERYSIDCVQTTMLPLL